MKIYEYQAKEILLKFRIAVPPGKAVETAADAKLAAEDLGVPVMIKAQIQAGGRGKGGGVKAVLTPAEAEAAAAEILNKRLITPQTSAEGILVKKVLIEKKLQAVKGKELYLAFTINREKECSMAIACASGGMGIEEVAREHPERIIQELIDPISGFRAFQLRNMAFDLGISGDFQPAFFGVLSGLYKLFEEKDCLLLEINPLIMTEDGRFFALDAKIIFDDNALFRHPEIQELAKAFEGDSLEAKAAKHGINYVKLDGNIGCLVNGAGLGMAVMDRIFQLGGKPANFLDIGGGAKPEQIEAAFEILLSDSAIKVILVNIFSGVFRVDSFLEGLRAALKGRKSYPPLIFRIDGDNTEEGLRAFKKAKIKFYKAKDMEASIKKALKLLKRGGK